MIIQFDLTTYRCEFFFTKYCLVSYGTDNTFRLTPQYSIVQIFVVADNNNPFNLHSQ